MRFVSLLSVTLLSSITLAGFVPMHLAPASASTPPPELSGFVPNFTEAIPFESAGRSVVVGGVTVAVTTNTGIRGNNNNTYLHQSTLKVRTVLTFNPAIPGIGMKTRNHADCNETGTQGANCFEKYTFTGKDASGTVVLAADITNSNETTSYVPGASNVGYLTGLMSTLEIDYTYDTGPPGDPVGLDDRGSYLEMFLTTRSIAPATQTVTGNQDSPITASTAYTATGFAGSVSYAVTSGTLPGGLILNATTGVITGTPTSTSTAGVTITATGASFGQATATVVFQLDVPVPVPAPAFTLSSSSESKPQNAAIAGYTITSTGGTVASYAISPPAPAGLTFSTSTGLLSGTPTTVQSATAYTITATNATGTATRTFTLTVTLAAPGVPLQPTVVSGDEQVTVSVAAGSGGTPASYTVSASPQVGGVTKTCTVTVPATSCIVTGLTSGTAYTFTATATNTTGTSAASAASAAVTPTLAAPGVPLQPTVVSGDEQVTVSVAAGSGGTPASYTVSASPQVGGVTKTCTVTVPATSCIVTGLTSGTAYTFTATATNTTGTSAASAASAAVTPTLAAQTTTDALDKSSLLPIAGSNVPAVAIWGLLLLTVGATLITLSRRRSVARH